MQRALSRRWFDDTCVCQVGGEQGGAERPLRPFIYRMTRQSPSRVMHPVLEQHFEVGGVLQQ